MTRTLSSIVLWLTLSLKMHAQNEPYIAMGKAEATRLFSQNIVEESTNGDITLRMPFYGHPASVFIGFNNGKAFMISASFMESTDRLNTLDLFRDVRKRLESLSGREYAYARVDGIDLLGESGGAITDKRKMNAFVFGTVKDGIVYQAELISGKISDMAKTGEVRLTIDREESVKPPTIQPNASNARPEPTK